MASMQSRIFIRVLQLIRFKKMWANLHAAAQTGDPAAFAQAVGRFRKRGDQRLPPAFMSQAADLTTRTVDGFPLHHMVAKDGGGKGVILYLHGGAYVIGPSMLHWRTLNTLLLATGLDIAVLDYPKAPEHTCATAIGVAQAAYQGLLNDYAPGQITLMGDSAGGGLALALAQHLKQDSVPLPGRVILVSPWLDVSLAHPELGRYAVQDVILDVEGLRACGAAYAGGLPLSHPWVSPGYGELDGLPPLHLFVGDREMFFPDVRDLYAAAKAAGTAASLEQGDGLPHAWFLFPLPESRATIARIGAVLAEQ